MATAKSTKSREEEAVHTHKMQERTQAVNDNLEDDIETKAQIAKETKKTDQPQCRIAFRNRRARMIAA